MSELQKINAKDLVMSDKRQRFLSELNDHLEDSMSINKLGTATELTSAFNMYATPKRNKKIALIIAIAILSFGTVFLTTHTAYLNTHGIDAMDASGGKLPLEDNFPFIVSAIVILLGIIFYFPVMFLVLMPSHLIMTVLKIDGQYSNFYETHLLISPFIACIFWTTVSTFLLFSPQELWSKLKK